jgi:hypothetical protein
LVLTTTAVPAPVAGVALVAAAVALVLVVVDAAALCVEEVLTGA